MFNKLITLKKFNNEIISIEELVDIVKNNPQINLINEIRNTEYKSDKYKNLKLKVSAITPHGTFKSIRNDGLISFSSYLYYDIDGCDTEMELIDTKNRLIELFPISFVCKSVGGRGLSFLIKINDTFSILNDTFDFDNIYSYVRQQLINEGFNIDKGASGIVRKMFISSDKDVYFNNEVSLSINKVSFQTFKQNLNKSKNINLKETVDTRLNDTQLVLNINKLYFDVIPFDKLISEIKIETLYTKEIDGKYVIEDMEYYKIILPKIIKDGNKHKLYIRIINALYYLNNKINRQQVYSYLHHYNNMASPKMNEIELKRLVNNMCNNIEKTKEIKIKPRIKKIHFNKNSNLTKKQKQSMGAQLGAKIRNNKTLELINEARLKCSEMNIEPTQKRISQLTGLSIATIKRNWKKEYNNLNELNIIDDNNDKINERDYKISQLIETNEELFFKSDLTNENIKVDKDINLNKKSQYEEDIKFWEEFNPKHTPTKSIEDEDFGDGDEIEGLIETF